MRESDYLTIAEFLDIIRDLPPWYKLGVTINGLIGEAGSSFLTKDDVMISRREGSVTFTSEADDGFCDLCERGNCDDCDRIDMYDCDGQGCGAAEAACGRAHECDEFKKF